VIRDALSRAMIRPAVNDASYNCQEPPTWRPGRIIPVSRRPVGDNARDLRARSASHPVFSRQAAKQLQCSGCRTAPTAGSV
jgi:hypothetical protein